MKEEQEETRSSFFWRNLIRGLAWFVVIITIFILAEGYIQTNFQKDIDAIQDKPVLVYSVFFLSEVIFGLIPPEFFMIMWILHKITLQDYIINLSILTLISYISGMIGYWIGKKFSKTGIYKKVQTRYLQQYNKQLKKYGVFLVLVGAVTPVPFSATCMLAGSVNLNFKHFLLICISRIVRFAVYGWMVWKGSVWF